MFNMDLSADEESTGHIGVGSQFPVPNIRLQPFDNKNRVIAPTRNLSSVGAANSNLNESGASMVNFFFYFLIIVLKTFLGIDSWSTISFWCFFSIYCTFCKFFFTC